MTRSDRNKTKIEDSIEALLNNYKSPRFISKLRIYIESTGQQYEKTWFFS